MEGLTGPDPFAADGLIAGAAERFAAGASFRDVQKRLRDGKAGAEDARRALVANLAREQLRDMRWLVAAPLGAPSAFRERLVAFWTDHFTVAATSRPAALLLADMIRTAIRPHVTGRFGDMLMAVTTHPAMLFYLNQVQSVGPGSGPGLRRGRGLNENLAREILELHSLGVGGAYRQDDVRAFAELLTGLSVDGGGFRFRPAIAEPGAEVLLGRSYGGGRARLGDIRAALQDIALHRDTARHLARKLVVHFIGMEPRQEHVDAIARAYLQGDGELTAAYAALLGDARAWEPLFGKARQPFDFVVAALRAAGQTAADIEALPPRMFRQGIVQPLALMGQPLMRPPGPDGWDEAAEAWITPPGLAARIRWAAGVAERLLSDRDPREFLDTTLADAAGPALRRAVGRAASRTDGLALVLASPEFNRR